MDEIIENDEFLLRKPEKKDAQFYFELMSHPNWIKNIGNRNILSTLDAENYILNKYLPHIEKWGFGSYIVIKKETQEKVGSAGLVQRNFIDKPDLGYAVHHHFYGQGIATKASSLILENAKKNGFSSLFAFIAPHNIQSQNVLNRLGFQEIGMRFVKEYQEDLMFFSIDL